MKTNELTDKQKGLRYSISVDFECMNDADYTKQSALDWFKTDECKEAYDGFTFEEWARLKLFKNDQYYENSRNFISNL